MMTNYTAIGYEASEGWINGEGIGQLIVYSVSEPEVVNKIIGYRQFWGISYEGAGKQVITPGTQLSSAGDAYA